MRELFRNPMLYYVLVPVLAGFWPLLVWGYYLPQSEKTLEQDLKLHSQTTDLILRLLQKDPDRVNVAEESRKIGKFTYAEAVDQVANICRIPSSSLDLTTGNIVSSGKKETQQARVSLSDIRIVQAARFLSTIQANWVNLTCDRVKLSKKEGMPDLWDMDLTFKYDY